MAPSPSDRPAGSSSTPAPAPRPGPAAALARKTRATRGPDPAASLNAIVPPATSVMVAVIVALVTLAWWTSTDRLDLPKQWVLVAATLLGGLITWARGRPVAVGPFTLVLLVAPLIAWAAAPAEGAARVEGWVGWLAAVALLVLARHASRAALGPPLTALALGLTLVAWLQAAGLPIFSRGSWAPGGRAVIGTLGGPDHMGWMLAMLLPWAGVTLLDRRHWRLTSLALVPLVGALILTGSRTSWVATFAALPFWLPVGRARLRGQGSTVWKLLWLLLVAGLGAGAAVGADRLAHRANLRQRAEDLGAPSGTAAGRLYLWRVHLSALPGQLGLGSGPESFVRQWPEWQQKYLSTHPEETHLETDLRHAHADPIEILTDFGVPGFLLGVWLLLRSQRRRPDESSPRGPPLGALATLVFAGLADAPIFFAPALALGAVCLGVRLGPPPHSATRLGKLLPALALALALIPLTQRLRSEMHRSEASRHRLKGRTEEALPQAREATRLDERNPRAWMEAAMAHESRGETSKALEAWTRVLVDLPTAAVRERFEQAKRRLAREQPAQGTARRNASQDAATERAPPKAARDQPATGAARGRPATGAARGRSRSRVGPPPRRAPGAGSGRAP